jgi:hypothetical protein
MDQYTGIRSEGKFYDDIHFPRGFSKHGIFTIREADALHTYGKVMYKLANQLMEPLSRDEVHFVKVCQQKAVAKTELERLWMKYQTAITTRADFFTVHSSFNNAGRANMESPSEGYPA